MKSIPSRSALVPFVVFVVFALNLAGTLPTTSAADWPQLQRDAGRTGRSMDEVAPPYRARWLWFAEAGTLRNRASKPNDSSWTNDLTTGVGKSYPLPASVPFTLSGMVQPIVHRGWVFVASQEGKAYAIREEDGTTAWSADLPGGSIATGAAAGSVVVFGSIQGGVYGFNITNGAPVWTVHTGKAITGAPCVVGDRVYVANHSRIVSAIRLETGEVLWKSEPLGGIVQGSLAATPDAVYVGAEDMKVY
jgi:outer membrane protein assembly factor BamB